MNHIFSNELFEDGNMQVFTKERLFYEIGCELTPEKFCYDADDIHV